MKGDINSVNTNYEKIRRKIITHIFMYQSAQSIRYDHL